MKYKVGQIIYLLSEKSLKIIPAQVVEEVIRNTLAGKEISYIIKMPDQKQTVVDISAIKANIFVDHNKLKEFMMENARQSIEGLINSAFITQEVFVPAPEAASDILPKQEIEEIIQPIVTTTKKSTPKRVQKKKKDDKIKVDIGGGIKANISVEDLTHLGME